jgi:hypothetical protein
MDAFHIMSVVERLARQQRLATLAAGIKAAHPAMYYGDIVTYAQRLDAEIYEMDQRKHQSE